MANVLKMAIVDSVLSLHSLHYSQRRIARWASIGKRSENTCANGCATQNQPMRRPALRPQNRPLLPARRLPIQNQPMRRSARRLIQGFEKFLASSTVHDHVPCTMRQYFPNASQRRKS